MAESYRDMLGRAAHLFEEAKGILSNPESTGEQKQSVEARIEEAKALKKRAMQLKDIEEAGIDQMLAEHQEKQDTQPDEAKGGRAPGEFKQWGEFLKASYNYMNPKYLGTRDPRVVIFKDDREPGMEGKAATMTGQTLAGGGALIPAQFLEQLYAAMGETAIVRPRASVIRMTRRQVTIPVLDQTASTSGVPHWFGGMLFYWAEEASEKTLTDADFRQINLVAKKLIGYTRASDELVDDSFISLGDFLSGPMGMAGGIAWNEDYAFLRGTGAGQPLGVLNAGATITVNRTSVANPITYTDIVTMMESFLPSGRGVWVCNQSGMSNLLTMQDQAGGAANTGSYLWGSAADGAPNRLLGMPIIFTEKLPTVGNAGDLLLADFNYYLLGDRQATTVESTQFDYWRYDQTSWRAVHRVDGQPWLSAPLTYQDGTVQVSPFVQLGAKST